jgi:hypothetical protein
MSMSMTSKMAAFGRAIVSVSRLDDQVWKDKLIISGQDE